MDFKNEQISFLEAIELNRQQTVGLVVNRSGRNEIVWLMPTALTNTKIAQLPLQACTVSQLKEGIWVTTNYKGVEPCSGND